MCQKKLTLKNREPGREVFINVRTGCDLTSTAAVPISQNRHQNLENASESPSKKKTRTLEEVNAKLAQVEKELKEMKENARDSCMQFMTSLVPYLKRVSTEHRLIIRAKIQHIFIKELNPESEDSSDDMSEEQTCKFASVRPRNLSNELSKYVLSFDPNNSD